MHSPHFWVMLASRSARLNACQLQFYGRSTQLSCPQAPGGAEKKTTLVHIYMQLVGCKVNKYYVYVKAYIHNIYICVCVCVCQHFFKHTTLENYHPRNANLSARFTNALIPIIKANLKSSLSISTEASLQGGKKVDEPGALRMVVDCTSLVVWGSNNVGYRVRKSRVIPIYHYTCMQRNKIDHCISIEHKNNNILTYGNYVHHIYMST